MRSPRSEARELLLHAALCTPVAALAALGILWRPLPLFDAAFTHDAWYAIGFKGLFMLMLPILWMGQRSYGAAHLRAGWTLSVRSAAALFVAVGAGTLINAGHLGPIGALAAEQRPGTLALALICGTLAPLLTAALPEEIAFRGLLQTRLEAVHGRPLAVLGTALLFTAWHLPSRYLLADGVEGRAGDFGSVLLGTGLPVLVIALIFGLLWDRYRSLPALVALHAGIDWLPAIRHALGGTF